MTARFRPVLLLVALAFLLSSCPGLPPPGTDGQPISDTGTDTQAPGAQDAFDPSTISPEMKESAFVDIRGLIDQLNTIIRNRDIDSWRAYLTEEYVAYYSDAATLAEISQEPALKRYDIVLRTLADYFQYVVYPSRQNMKVDDIEFVGPDHVRAITVNLKGERLVLYNLEKIGDTWKIGIWR